MRIQIALLILCSGFSFGQTVSSYKVTVTPTDSLHFSFEEQEPAIYAQLRQKYSNWHQRARALEKYMLAIENPGVKRNADSTLTINLLNNQELVLNPDVVNDQVDFTFEHHFKELELLLFRVQWGEGNDYLLVDRQNGKKTNIIGRPYFSPNRRFMIAINCDIEAQYSGNGFELYTINGRDMKSIWRYDPITWGPMLIAWINNSTLISKNRSMREGDGRIVTSYSKIQISGTK